MPLSPTNVVPENPLPATIGTYLKEMGKRVHKQRGYTRKKSHLVGDTAQSVPHNHAFHDHLPSCIPKIAPFRPKILLCSLSPPRGFQPF